MNFKRINAKECVFVVVVIVIATVVVVAVCHIISSFSFVWFGFFALLKSSKLSHLRKNIHGEKQQRQQLNAKLKSVFFHVNIFIFSSSSSSSSSARSSALVQIKLILFMAVIVYSASEFTLSPPVSVMVSPIWTREMCKKRTLTLTTTQTRGEWTKKHFECSTLLHFREFYKLQRQFFWFD